MQTELMLNLWQTGDRMIELPGSLSQRCGVLIGFQPLACVPYVLYPVVRWDIGTTSYSSNALGLRRLEQAEQLSLCLDI